ncbi:MAG: hypothetical protein ACRCZS_18940, partial [Chroococcidiopsis sp.]
VTYRAIAALGTSLILEFASLLPLCLATAAIRRLRGARREAKARFGYEDSRPQRTCPHVAAASSLG